LNEAICVTLGDTFEKLSTRTIGGTFATLADKSVPPCSFAFPERLGVMLTPGRYQLLQDGYQNGLNEGRSAGFDDGLVAGDATGYSRGVEAGKAMGDQTGYERGYREGFAVAAAQSGVQVDPGSGADTLPSAAESSAVFGFFFCAVVGCFAFAKCCGVILHRIKKD
jgi:hypothetical protein